MPKYGRSRQLTDEELYLEFVRNQQHLAGLQEPGERRIPSPPASGPGTVGFLESNFGSQFASPSQDAYLEAMGSGRPEYSAGRDMARADKAARDAEYDNARKRAMEMSDYAWRRVLTEVYDPRNPMSDKALGEVATQYAATYGTQVMLPNPVRIASTKADQQDPALALAKAREDITKRRDYKPGMEMLVRVNDKGNGLDFTDYNESRRLDLQEKKDVRDSYALAIKDAEDRVDSRYDYTGLYGAESDALKKRHNQELNRVRDRIRKEFYPDSPTYDNAEGGDGIEGLEIPRDADGNIKAPDGDTVVKWAKAGKLADKDVVSVAGDDQLYTIHVDENGNITHRTPYKKRSSLGWFGL